MVEAIKEVSKSIVDVSQPRYLDYVQIVISIISVVVSGVAIWFAISVPKKIAENQNRISLFEKRFEFYDQLCLCISFSRMIKNIQTHEEIVKFFIATFGRELVKDTSEEGNRGIQSFEDFVSETKENENNTPPSETKKEENTSTSSVEQTAEAPKVAASTTEPAPLEKPKQTVITATETLEDDSSSEAGVETLSFE